MTEEVCDLPGRQPGLVQQRGDRPAEGSESHPLVTRRVMNGFHARLRTFVASRIVPVELGKIGPFRSDALDRRSANNITTHQSGNGMGRSAFSVFPRFTTRARQLLDRADRRQVASLLTLALRAADGVAYKYRYYDLSARLIDLMRATANESEDPLLPAAVSYVRTETFFASGDLHTAARALDQAADQIPTRNLKQAATAAAFGSL
ncbi:hypothetical protein ACFXGA_26840 [Actinosynnema sp. NPDC059335]|uniref:hypothetical protein n=1 Tax=Actinosynnema sp. NPDC059335 TaxID=3346804 RepID=UPI003670589C